MAPLAALALVGQMTHVRLPGTPPTSPRVVLVTGASSGLGASLCAALLRADGVRVLACARNPDSLDPLAAALPAGARARLARIALDLADPESIERAAARAAALCGEQPLQALVLNAGGIATFEITFYFWRN